MTVRQIELKQRQWIAFAGIVVAFEAPEDNEAALADRARKTFMEKLGADADITEFDIGVADIQLHPADDI